MVYTGCFQGLQIAVQTVRNAGQCGIAHKEPERRFALFQHIAGQFIPPSLVMTLYQRVVSKAKIPVKEHQWLLDLPQMMLLIFQRRGNDK